MSYMMESFYVTLCSEQSWDYYPNNRPNHFTVNLPKTLKFAPKSYEVGLAQLYFTPHFGKADKPKFFGKVPNDDKIDITTWNEKNLITVVKEVDDILKITNMINQKFEKMGIKVHFDL